jgi:hypothetical protein
VGKAQTSYGGQPTRHEGAKIGVSSFWADFNGADLSGLDLYQGKPGAGFTGIDLIGADLRSANLKGTHLAWADLTGATLSGADLQENGIRCWIYYEDLRTGGKQWDEIYKAIKTHDKLLLVFSAASVKSEWVEDEVNAALAEERERGKLVLFPIRIDDAEMDTEEAWAARVRNSRHIGNFTRWSDQDVYKRAFERLLRDLRTAND